MHNIHALGEYASVIIIMIMSKVKSVESKESFLKELHVNKNHAVEVSLL